MPRKSKSIKSKSMKKKSMKMKSKSMKPKSMKMKPNSMKPKSMKAKEAVARCMKCRENKQMINMSVIVLSNGRSAMSGVCQCGTKMFKFVSAPK